MGAEKRSHLWGGGIECESMKFAGAQHQQRVGCCCCSKSGGKRAAARQCVEEGKHGVTLSEWLPCLIPPALALGVYTNSLGGEFVHDDLSAITANRDITDPAAGTWDFLYNDFWGTSLLDPLSHKSYRPLTILTFKWNYALSGLNPWSYHAVNVILHAAVSALFAWLCLNCLGLSKLSSLLTASLFAIHPIHTEAVSGIVGRADILTTLFFLLSFISHDRATMHNQKSGGIKSGSRHPVTCFNVPLLRIVSLLSAFLALAAKENGIAALPVAITWDIIRLHQQSASSCDSTRRCGRGKIYTSPSNKPRSRWNSCSCWPWLRVVFKCWPILLSLFTTLVLLAARIALQQGQLPLFSEQDNPAAFASSRKARILTMLYLPAFNMGLLLAPVLLSYDWQNGSIPLVEDWRDWRNVGTLFFYTSLAVTLVYAWLHRKKVILWSAAVMVWPMLPASNLFYPCGFVVAERLLYLPSLGYCLIVALGLRIVFRSTRSRWTIRAGRLVSHQSATGSYASLRRRRSSSTCSSSSFSSSSSSSSSSSTSSSSANCWWPGRQVFARCLFVFGATLLAVSFATKTWTRNLDWADRRTLFESGLRTLPNNAKMHYNYANVQKDEGRWEKAIDHYRTAIELWPNYASALNNLGTVLLARADDMEDGDRRKELAVQEAELRFREAIRSHPHHAHAHYNLAVLHLQRNETEQALHLLNQVLTLNSNHREALNLLHWLQAEKKSGNVDTGSSSNGRTLNHYRDAEKTTIGAIPAAHHSPAPAMPMAGHWITANRLQHQQQPKLHHQPQREESRQHRSGTTSNYRWNKTAKN